MRNKILVVGMLIGLLSPSAFGVDYYVSTSGSDGAPGSLAQPFATIQHAVSVMDPGDICYLRGGTYRETVDLSGVTGASGNPITLTRYQDEEVILSGTLPITSNWTQHNGNIFKTTLSEDVWQLFVDGKHMTLARFPNALAFSDEVWERTTARRMKDSEQSTNGSIVDAPTEGAVATLAGAGVSFDGCVGVFNFGNFATSAGVVSSHTAGSGNFDYSPPVNTFKVNSDAYFFEGGVNAAELVMLDSAEEWAYDESTRELYLWADDGLDPSGRTIEGKRQTYFFEGDSSTRHITVDGLKFFGTTFYFDSSDSITIQNCIFDYYSFSKRALGSTAPSAPAFFNGSGNDDCDEVTVYNCEFNYSTGPGLRGEGVNGCLVENNLFYKNSYACVDGNGLVPSPATVQLRGNDVVFRRNTIDTSGSGQGVKLQGNVNNPWIGEYNYFTACGLLQTDGAALYTFESAGVESVGRNNWFVGNRARDFRWDGANDPLRGIHANVYRNVAMAGNDKINQLYTLKGDFHEIYNNVGISPVWALDVRVDKGGNANTLTRNNAADSIRDNPIPGTSSNNYDGELEAKTMLELLRDPNNFDFRPRADAAELIDQGVPVTCSVDGQDIDITAGHHGTAPDIGAYEYGDTEYWIPGRRLSQASMPVPPSGNQNVKLDADLMWLGGLDATSYDVYFGTESGNLTFQGNQTNNIFSPGFLTANTEYYWRIDSVGPGGTVVGEEWVADTTVSSSSFTAAEDTRCFRTGSQNYGTDVALWIQDNHTRRMYAKFHVSGIDAAASAILQLTVAEGPIPDIDVYSVTGEWEELTLTGANDELVWGDLLDTQLNCIAGSTYAFDVSAFVTGDGTYTLGIKTDADVSGLRILARESGEATAPTLIVTPEGPNDSPYEVWKSTYGITDDLADDDNDGIVNRLEFALGGNPNIPDAEGRSPTISRNGSASEFRFFRGQASLDYIVESSADLEHWESFTTVDDSHGLVGSSATVLIPDSQNESSRLFLRLKVVDAAN